MTERKTKAAKAQPTVSPLMYVGPTVAAIGTQNCVYSEVPPLAKQAIEKAPILGRLFIPIRQYPLAERQITRQSGAIWDAYKKAYELAKGGV